MSKENVAKFYELARKDQNLSKKLYELDEKVTIKTSDIARLGDLINEYIIPIAREKGLNFTAEEMLEYANERYLSLSEEDLAQVSGGLSPKTAAIGLGTVLGVGSIAFAATQLMTSPSVDKKPEIRKERRIDQKPMDKKGPKDEEFEKLLKKHEGPGDKAMPDKDLEKLLKEGPNKDKKPPKGGSVNFRPRTAKIPSKAELDNLMKGMRNNTGRPHVNLDRNTPKARTLSEDEFWKKFENPTPDPEPIPPKPPAPNPEPPRHIVNNNNLNLNPVPPRRGEVVNPDNINNRNNRNNNINNNNNNNQNNNANPRINNNEQNNNNNMRGNNINNDSHGNNNNANNNQNNNVQVNPGAIQPAAGGVPADLKNYKKYRFAPFTNNRFQWIGTSQYDYIKNLADFININCQNVNAGNIDGISSDLKVEIDELVNKYLCRSNNGLVNHKDAFRGASNLDQESVKTITDFAKKIGLYVPAKINISQTHGKNQKPDFYMVDYEEYKGNDDLKKLKHIDDFLKREKISTVQDMEACVSESTIEKLKNDFATFKNRIIKGKVNIINPNYGLKFDGLNFEGTLTKDWVYSAAWPGYGNNTKLGLTNDLLARIYPFTT